MLKCKQFKWKPILVFSLSFLALPSCLIIDLPLDVISPNITKPLAIPAGQLNSLVAKDIPARLWRLGVVRTEEVDDGGVKKIRQVLDVKSRCYRRFYGDDVTHTTLLPTIEEEPSSNLCGSSSDFDVAADLAQSATTLIAGGFAIDFQDALLPLEALPTDCVQTLLSPYSVKYDLSFATVDNKLTFSIPASAIYLSKSILGEPIVDEATLKEGENSGTIIKLGDLDEIPAEKDAPIHFDISKGNFLIALPKLLSGKFSIIVSPKPFEKANLQRKDKNGKLQTYIPNGTANLKWGLTVRWAATLFNAHCILALADAVNNETPK
jgi:hypothetical protein